MDNNNINVHSIASSVYERLEYYFYNTYLLRGCGMPLQAIWSENGKTFFKGWKRIYEKYGVEFPYNENQFGYAELGVGLNKRVIIYSFPAEKIGDRGAVIFLMDKAKLKICHVYLILCEDGQYEIVTRVRANNFFYSFGKVSYDELATIVVDYFDVIIDAVTFNYKTTKENEDSIVE